MQRVDALLEALEGQATFGQRVRASQLSLASPCRGWSVRDELNHSIGVTLKFAEFASGATDHPRSPLGDLVGPDHRLAMRAAADTGHAAWATVDMTRSCHLSFGTFSADLAAGINLFDVLAHTGDISTATGVALECADELWDAGLDAARAVIGADRDLQQYGPEIAVGPSASSRERFLGFLGRLER